MQFQSKSTPLEIIEKYGKNLKYLQYYQPCHDHEQVVDFIDYTVMADTLEELGLTMIDFQQYFVFGRLRKLRVVEFCQESCTDFDQMLKKCPKLRHFDFSRMTLSPVLLNSIVFHLNKFANHHPKRQITFCIGNADLNICTFIEY